ncbi:MAG TPA: XRE family transcriptional regulator [Vicinamibacterales bacterium]|nr:XRE family transcriptional regulator [Vicinamibacterales bacterium]
MGKVTEVPVTPAVLDWAIAESGYTLSEVADATGVELEDLHAWLKGKARPGVIALRSLAQTLRRPVAAFFLPRPPTVDRPDVRFRHLPGVPSRALTPSERRYLRKAARLQRMIGWLADELREPQPGVLTAGLNDEPADVARVVRDRFGVSVESQVTWASASAAFDAWRAMSEDLGVVVFLFQLGADSCRGFSLWHDRAPVVAINTAWNDEARTFTLLHELGHLITRTNSACVTAPPAAVSGTWDPAERWCERFAAAVVVPESALRELVAARLGAGATKVTDVATVRWLAGRFRASLRAVALRLIELGLSDWNLYRSLPATGDAKRGGGGGKGRDRQEIQEDQLGDRAFDLFKRAVDADVVSRSQALTYLDVPETALDSLGTRSA